MRSATAAPRAGHRPHSSTLDLAIHTLLSGKITPLTRMLPPRPALPNVFTAARRAKDRDIEIGRIFACADWSR